MDAAMAFTQAAEAYCGPGDERGQARALIGLGNVQRLTGDPHGALRTLTQAVDMCRRLGDRGGQSRAMVEMGTARQAIADYPGALETLGEALEMFRSLKERYEEAWAVNRYADAITAAGDPMRSLSLYRQALQIKRSPDDEPFSLQGIGNCLVARGDRDEGMSHLRKALEHFQRLGMRADAERVTARLHQLSV